VPDLPTIAGCDDEKDDTINVNVTYAAPGLEAMAEEAHANAKALLAGDEESDAAVAAKKQEAHAHPEHVLNVVVQLGGMSCADAIAPKTNNAVSRSMSVVLQTDRDRLQTTLLCNHDNATAAAALPIEERVLEVNVQITCLSKASKVLKKNMVQSLNGAGLSAVTEAIVSELLARDACPPAATAAAMMTDQDLQQGGCSNVVVESMTPKHPGVQNQQFVTVFGFTMGDLIRMVGTPLPGRQTGPPVQGMQGMQGTAAGPSWLQSENQRLLFVRSFLEEYNLQVLLKDSEDWATKVSNGMHEKLKETKKKYAAALRVYQSAVNHKNPALDLQRLNSGTTNRSNFEVEMARVQKEEEKKVEESSRELKEYTHTLAHLERQANNASEPFAWPTEHALVEHWLGIGQKDPVAASANNSGNATMVPKGPTMEEQVKMEENEAARKAKQLFLAQRQKIWAARMKEMKAAAAEEHLKEKDATMIHDRRIRIASEQLDLQHAAYLKVKQRLKDKKNEELNKKYLRIENRTDSRDATEYMEALKETAKLQARSNQLHDQDVHFEKGVDTLKKVEAGTLNMTHVEKEALAEEVQDDMQALDIARARAAAEATEAEMKQTEKEFNQVKELQQTQKTEDTDTMEQAAEAVEVDQGTLGCGAWLLWVWLLWVWLLWVWLLLLLLLWLFLLLLLALTPMHDCFFFFFFCFVKCCRKNGREKQHDQDYHVHVFQWHEQRSVEAKFRQQ
jgi:hypothetical protein